MEIAKGKTQTETWWRKEAWEVGVGARLESVYRLASEDKCKTFEGPGWVAEVIP